MAEPLRRAGRWLQFRAIAIIYRAYRPAGELIRRSKQWLALRRTALVRWLSIHGGRGPGWLSTAVREELTRASPSGARPSKLLRLKRGLRTPGREALLVVVGFYFAMFAVTVLVQWWNPEVRGLPEEIDSAYVTMWQVQAAIAAFALPLLLFFIEISRDNREAATRTPEVLIRESAALSVIAFSLLGAFRIGFDIAWFESESVFVIDLFVILLATIGLALWAYFVVLKMILSPTRLKDKSTELLREWMRRTVRHSLEVRVGTNILFARLKAIGADYWPWIPGPSEGEQFAVLRAGRDGYLADVHLDELEAFIDQLPWLPAAPTAVATQRPTVAAAPTAQQPPSVWFLKKYGDRVSVGNSGLLRLERSAFRELDEDFLSRSLAPLVKIRPTDDL